jgi:hypothetical protein
MLTPVDSASWYLRRDAVDSPSSSSPSLSDGPGSIDGPFFEGGMIDRRGAALSPALGLPVQARRARILCRFGAQRYFHN